MIVFLDACHSGGVTTRAVSGSRSPLVSPKYYSRSVASGEVCEKPVNILRRSLSVQARSVGSGANNYVYIAAARDAEVSLDMPTKGGVAIPLAIRSACPPRHALLLLDDILQKRDTSQSVEFRATPGSAKEL